MSSMCSVYLRKRLRKRLLTALLSQNRSSKQHQFKLLQTLFCYINISQL